MNLTTKTRVRRSQWKPMVTTELIVDITNHFEDKKHPEVPEELKQPPTTQETAEVAVLPTDLPAEQQDGDQIVEEPVPDLVDAPDNSDDEEEEAEEEPDGGIASRTIGRGLALTHSHQAVILWQ